jgi:transposase
MPGTKYSAELKAKAVRLVREHSGDYPSQWAAIGAVAQRLGIGSSETLRKWVRQAETDEGARPGTTTAEAAEIRRLRRKVSELERTLEILTEATRFFAREADPLRR